MLLRKEELLVIYQKTIKGFFIVSSVEVEQFHVR